MNVNNYIETAQAIILIPNSKHTIFQHLSGSSSSSSSSSSSRCRTGDIDPQWW